MLVSLFVYIIILCNYAVKRYLVKFSNFYILIYFSH